MRLIPIIDPARRCVLMIRCWSAGTQACAARCRRTRRRSWACRCACSNCRYIPERGLGRRCSPGIDPCCSDPPGEHADPGRPGNWVDPARPGVRHRDRALVEPRNLARSF